MILLRIAGGLLIFLIVLADVLDAAAAVLWGLAYWIGWKT